MTYDLRLKLTFLFFFLTTCLFLHAQTFPKENSKLNYTIIGFSFPSVPQASEYRVEIAEGDHASEASFKKSIVKSVVSSENRLIADVPSFGKNYTWRVVSKNNSAETTGGMHHFSTLTIDDVNPDSMRMRIEKSAEKYRDAYYFSDINRALYDMTGRPVWFIPHTDKLNFEIRQVRDLKMTNTGTITFLIGGHDAYEINYNGDILWKAPKTRFLGYLNEATTERYNHELTRLSNGHYMILNSEFVWSDPNATPPRHGEFPPPPKPGEPNHPIGHPVLFGTIIEYDEKGNTVWSWKSAPYFQHSDLMSDPNRMASIRDDVHQNSFFFDEKNKMVYLCYKNIHRIIKVKYPEGTVTESYGEIYRSGEPEKGNNMFCYPHSVKLSQQGYVYLFNNNSCHPDRAPQIIMLREPVSKTDSVKIAWQYEFPVEPLGELFKQMKMVNNQLPDHSQADETVGGNAIELPDQSMFASLCSPYGDLFIVDRDKKVLWHAINEKWSTRENKWSHINTYRANIILNRHDLENIIWNSLPKN
jgi:hypothetical protein